MSVKSFAQTFDYKENSVYIYNFIKYTGWQQKKPVIKIGVLGNSPVEEELKQLVSSKKNNNVTYTVKKITPDEAKTSDVIIVSKSSSELLKTINKITDGLPILIISEKEGLSRWGACISFFQDEDNNYKTEYQLSLRNCKLRGLTISDQITNNSILMR